MNLVYSKPERHFLGLCTNNFECLSLHPVQETTYDAFEIQSYDRFTGLQVAPDRDSTENDETPTIDTVYHFERLDIPPGTRILQATLTIDVDVPLSSADPVAAVPFDLRVEDNVTPPVPSLVTDYDDFAWHATVIPVFLNMITIPASYVFDVTSLVVAATLNSLSDINLNTHGTHTSVITYLLRWTDAHLTIRWRND